MTSIEQRPEYFEFVNRILNVKFDPAQSVCFSTIDPSGKILGVAVFSRFMPHNCELSVASITPTFLTRGLLDVVFHYAFVTAKKRRVTAVIEDGNDAALKMDLRLGFTEEGRLKNWYGDRDGIILRMLREECRWIKEQS